MKFMMNCSKTGVGGNNLQGLIGNMQEEILRLRKEQQEARGLIFDLKKFLFDRKVSFSLHNRAMQFFKRYPGVSNGK